MNALETFQSNLHAVIHSGDPGGLDAMIADPFVMHTPRFLRPVTDRRHCLAILRGIMHLIPDITYHRAWTNADSVAMEFRGHVRDTDVLVHGLDLFTVGPDARATELTVFLRPTKALDVLGTVEDAMVKRALAGGQGGS